MLKNALTVVLSCLAFLLVGEFGYRGYQAIAYDRTMFGQGDGPLDASASAVVGHPFFHYAPNPALPDVELDFTRRTGSSAPAGAPTILMLGGSTTYDTSVAWNQSAAAQLQKRLGMQAKVINSGAPGYRLAHVYSRYIHQFRGDLRPGSLVVLDLGHNDLPLFSGFLPSDNGYAGFAKVVHGEDAFLRNFRILNLLRSRADAVLCAQGYDGLFDGHLNVLAYQKSCAAFPAMGQKFSAEAEARYVRTLDGLTTQILADGGTPIILLQDYDKNRMSAGYAAAHERMRAALQAAGGRSGVAVVDTRIATRSEPRLFADDLHMNAKGNAMRAALLQRVARERPSSREPSPTMSQ